jgi:hypothetical protein
MVAKKEEESKQLAVASIADGAVQSGDFYSPGSLAALGITPEKLIIPKEFHKVIKLCYDFYQRGGIVATVINRLTELTITQISNGQRNTSDEANHYFNAVLHRSPSRMARFIRGMALEYFLSGLVVPRVEWKKMLGEEISPHLKANREYEVPVFDLYPPELLKIEWDGWGKKRFLLKIPSKDARLIKSNGRDIKNQLDKARYDVLVSSYPSVVEAVRAGSQFVELRDVDPILRKELSFTEYPTPFLFNILEHLIFKQQLRRMDFAVASRVINAILLITEGNDMYPAVEESRKNLDDLKAQIYARTNDPRLQERLFMLFSNHTTELTWITPDVAAMLDQDKYRQTNDEIGEGLGFAKILVTGESRNAQASEVSTWAIQPMMEELREMLVEWIMPVYEEAQKRNKFKYVPEPTFSPIRLQDFIKTAAVFAQLFKEGNISRKTRDQMAGIDFLAELENMRDEYEEMKELEKDFPMMPYDITNPDRGMSPIGGGPGKPAGAPKGGRPLGSQNPAVNKRNRGVKPPGQSPVSRVAAEVEVLGDEEFLQLVNTVMTERGIVLTPEDL